MSPPHPALVSASAPLDGETVALARQRAASAVGSPLRTLTTRHAQIAALVASGASDGAVASAVGVEPEAVGRLRASPAFRELVAKLAAR